MNEFMAAKAEDTSIKIEVKAEQTHGAHPTEHTLDPKGEMDRVSSRVPAAVKLE